LEVLHDFLRLNDGIITASQARGLGFSNDALERRARSGHWRRCSPGVYFVDDRPFTDAARIRAAVWGHGPRAAGSALQRHVELKPLWEAHLRNKGRHGSPAARLLLQAAQDGTRSAAERLLAHLLREAGITGWLANHPVAGYCVDFGFHACKLALETDGLAFHTDADDFHRDRVRQNAITLAGWTVLRFTWLDLTEYPERVIAEIRYAISARTTALTAD
jgi:very-short-patch-repair endonuclease